MSVVQHVLIVGGGLAGPCLALSLARQGIRSTIFELRPGPSDSGGSISFGPDALRVLDKHANVYEKLKAVGYAYDRMTMYFEDGSKLGQVLVGEEKENGYPALRIMRSAVQKVLLEAVRGKSDFIDLKFDARISMIEEGEKGVTALFEDGSKAEGDILVGADGIHSKVRDHVLGPEAPTPIFTKTQVVNGFIPATAAVKPSPDFTFPAFVVTPGGIFMTLPIDSNAETLTWGITTSAVERTREGWTEYEKSGEAIRTAKQDFDDIQTEPVRSLLDNVDGSKARVWAPYSIPTLPRWHTERVCLIGDAAHALEPNGQGSAIAFQDAALLSRFITSKSPDASYGQLFKRFEELRKPKIAEISKNSKPAGALKAKSGPWVWSLKKWAMWGFFTWNRGTLRMHKGPAYDVDDVDLAL
ncbi:uncharacterized protein I303_106902 [Kwoniella dejecticola CBS 10117]|uniref:FAD-binding domain-containing protein n=1 Tax=Kwoniella dejecticola CBS 10117 TaxID=1296121 RepID=A0A1A5ZTD9_9TREE|nr:uncharacterized protein I303_08459 [Kwoniella dejecticola CBS 10117]OBR81077.1 hypothetical protein I303_08459 [Kwoniella dejecticola CBS 10117]